MLRRSFIQSSVAISTLPLIGCSSGSLLTPPSSRDDVPQQQTQANVIGNGPVRIGMILPLSAVGNAGVVAGNLRNAAELALAEFAGHDLTLLIKDDGGNAQGAANAAQALMSEGAQLIIGPLFSESTKAAGQVVTTAGKSMIAFTTDPQAARKGVYLLSFLAEPAINRAIRYSVSQGTKSFAAMISQDAAGQIAEGAYLQAVVSAGGRNMAIEHFRDAASMQAAARKLAAISSTINAIFLPDPADGAAIVALRQVGFDPSKIQFVGAGQWDGNAEAAKAAPSAIYAAPDGASFRGFAGRYRARFNADPVRIASLGYDAVSLAAGLSKAYGATRFSDINLTSRTGFTGIDGLFRFKADGTNERGLSVLKAAGGVVSPAPKAFS
jgi:ABC-type branched-subunit amino acid transport system substrate-binding protein